MTEVELLACLLLHSIADESLGQLSSLMLPSQDTGLSKTKLIDRIVATKEWEQIIEVLKINDFRVCSECGALMHQGFCYNMGYKYYCSERCLRHDFTTEEWELECMNEPQSYWTDWFEHYELTNKKQRYGTNI